MAGVDLTSLWRMWGGPPPRPPISIDGRGRAGGEKEGQIRGGVQKGAPGLLKVDNILQVDLKEFRGGVLYSGDPRPPPPPLQC